MPLGVMCLFWLIILAVIAAILLLLLFTPLGVSVDYAAGGLKAAVRVMCFDVTVFPRPEKAEKPKKKKKPAKAKKPKEDKPEKEGKKKFELNRDMIPDLLKLALDTLSRFRRKITVNRFVLHIIVGGDDPYDAVMSYGMINYAVATVGSAAGRAFNVKKSDVQTGLDFSNPHYTVEAGMTVTIKLARILAVVAVAGIGFLKIKRRSDKAAKAASQERKEKDGQDADTKG